MRKTLTYLTALVCLASLTAAAEDFWVKKKHTEWSDKECQKMLKDSPWAHEWSSGFVQIPQTGDAVGAERRQNPHLGYIFQLRSALPIRQGLVRLGQLAQGYEKMTHEEKQVFDREAQQFLGAQFPDKVVVYVEYSSNVGDWVQTATRYWQKETAETLKDRVYLIGAKGLRVSPVQYTPPRGNSPAFQFVFPRMVEGRPLVEPQDKALQLQMPSGVLTGRSAPLVVNLSDEQILVEFKVKKMTVDGELVF